MSEIDGILSDLKTDLKFEVVCSNVTESGILVTLVRKYLSSIGVNSFIWLVIVYDIVGGYSRKVGFSYEDDAVECYNNNGTVKIPDWMRT